MAKQLGSSELLFQSFRHSQGANGLQLQEFRYMDLTFGIPTDLQPDPETWQRLVSYINGVHTSPKRQHIRLRNVETTGAETAVHKAIEQLRQKHNEPYGRRVRSLDLPKSVAWIASTLIDREVEILGYESPWSAYSDGDRGDRPARLEARVKAGRSSFLLHHGRDGNTTGYAEFDQMYRDVWNFTQDDSYAFTEKLERHNLAVMDAELRYLGSLSLATA